MGGLGRGINQYGRGNRGKEGGLMMPLKILVLAEWYINDIGLASYTLQCSLKARILC